MPDLPKRFEQVRWQLLPVEFDDPLTAYTNGYQGAYFDPDGEERLQETIESRGGIWSAEAVAYEFGFVDQGRGKLCLITEEIAEVFGKESMPGAAQQCGDCFPAGTQVTMADGTTKPIEQVAIGDTVLSHLGTPRPVTSTICKPFSGELVKIRAKGSPRFVSATPDHRFVTVINGESRWCPIDLLSVGDRVSLPRHDAAAPEVVFDLADCPNAMVLGTEGRHISKAASNLALYGSNAVAVFPRRASECRVNLSRVRSKAGTTGMVSRIVSAERVPFTGSVYCIEVEEDHSFIANGYAVHNCVAHSTKNAILGTLSTAISHGISGRPITTPEGIKQGVLAPEAIYGFRGYPGDGWSCQEALDVAIRKVGAVSRRNHPDANWDLTLYSKANAHKYGAKPPSQTVIDALGQHKAVTVTKCSSYETVRDLIASGYALTSCGSEGFASKRNEDGVAARQGKWMHAMAYLGVDDRDETKKKYGCGLVLVMNSWGKGWIDGSTKIRGTDLNIPEGSFWAKWTDIHKRFSAAVNTVEWWQLRELPDLNLRELI